MADLSNYKKYRWFFTSSGKLVIGGKNSGQNEILVKELMKSGRDYIVMHTSKPGSPFTFLLDSGVNERDLEEQAIFTACFSQEWKKARKNAEIDIFNSQQIVKKSGMKEGTFGIIGKVIKRRVNLELWLEFQDENLRAVPVPSHKIAKILPGKTEKSKAAKEIAEFLKSIGKEVKEHEILQAIPAGNMTWTKEK